MRPTLMPLGLPLDAADLAHRVGHRGDLLAAFGHGVDRPCRSSAAGRRSGAARPACCAASTSFALAAASALRSLRSSAASSCSAAFFAAAGAAAITAALARAAMPSRFISSVTSAAFASAASGAFMASIVANRSANGHACTSQACSDSRDSGDQILWSLLLPRTTRSPNRVSGHSQSTSMQDRNRHGSSSLPLRPLGWQRVVVQACPWVDFSSARCSCFALVGRLYLLRVSL